MALDKAARLRQWVEPKADTCCFRCYLPTIVCKGPLLTNEGEGCFSARLILIFWYVYAATINERKVEDPYLDDQLLPKAWTRKEFQRPDWKFDTEIIGGALVFYYFALGYWYREGWN